MLYSSPDAVDFQLHDLDPLPLPPKVVMTTPTYFDVQYVINPHMAGHVGTIDQDVAAQQWKSLRAAYTALDIPVHVIEGQPRLPDMVFCANQTLPFCHPATETHGVVLSRMHAEERQEEVQHYADFFAQNGYEVHALPDDVGTDFEGMGDAIWHPGRYLLWGGYGFRSGRDAYEAIADLLDVDVITLALTDPDFYHLDTCFSVLDQHSVLIYPDAFNDTGRALIDRFFTTIVEAPEDESRHQFACNAHCPDGRHVLIQEGCTDTSARLSSAGFSPVPLDTSEFIKAGGSVFCMKQMVW